LRSGRSRRAAWAAWAERALARSPLAIPLAIALAIALASLLTGPCAQAQSATETRIAPPVSRKARPAPPWPAPDPLLETSAEQEPATAPAMGEADAEDGAGDGVALIRAVLTDTGAEPDPEEQGPTAVDGVIIADGSVSALDGIAVGGAEPHTAEDIAAFQLPPSGYDPYMFRIEPEPLRDRRPAELFHIEPYDPTGVRIGGFVIFPEAEISGLATNNVFKSPQRRELVAELGLDYYVGRDTILFGRYQHIAFDSTLPASDSNADVLRLGVRVRY
jgi:Putative beta-barrel porin 2